MYFENEVFFHDIIISHLGCQKTRIRNSFGFSISSHWGIIVNKKERLKTNRVIEILLRGKKKMIIIDRTKCVSCGTCSAMTLTFTCLQNTGDYEVYAEPPKQDRDYVQRIMRECWAHCIYLSGDTWEEDE